MIPKLVVLNGLIGQNWRNLRFLLQKTPHSRTLILLNCPTVLTKGWLFNQSGQQVTTSNTQFFYPVWGKHHAEMLAWKSTQRWIKTHSHPHKPCSLTPAERHCARPIGAFLDKRLVELASRCWVDASPTRLTVVLQAGHVGTEERSKLPTAVNASALVTDLVVKNIRLHLNLVAHHTDSKMSAFYRCASSGRMVLCAHSYGWLVGV